MDEADARTLPGSPDDEPLPLLIVVAPSPDERIRFAERLGGLAPLLLVADLDELRALVPAPPASPRTAAPHATPLAVDIPLIDPARSTASYRGREIGLTRLEHDLLSCLTGEPLRVWSYAELHRTVWRDGGSQGKADVRSLVKRLRHKLDTLGTGATIRAVRGVGFRLVNR